MPHERWGNECIKGKLQRKEFLHRCMELCGDFSEISHENLPVATCLKHEHIADHGTPFFPLGGKPEPYRTAWTRPFAGISTSSVDKINDELQTR